LDGEVLSENDVGDGRQQAGLEGKKLAGGLTIGQTPFLEITSLSTSIALPAIERESFPLVRFNGWSFGRQSDVDSGDDFLPVNISKSPTSSHGNTLQPEPETEDFGDMSAITNRASSQLTMYYSSKPAGD